MKKTVLLVQFDDRQELLKIKMALVPLGIRIRTVEQPDYLRTIGELIQGEEAAEDYVPYDGDVKCERMMIMGGFAGTGIDMVLSALRKQNVARIPYKAILTDTNKEWNCLKLYQELKEEHEQFESMKKQ